MRGYKRKIYPVDNRTMRFEPFKGPKGYIAIRKIKQKSKDAIFKINQKVNYKKVLEREYINREKLYEILKYKYHINSGYDPCSYPGIQCKFYYNPDVGIQCGSQISEENKSLYKNINEVSFMIFRTGSVLIVGKCDENVLMIIYEFLKVVLNNEYKNISQKNVEHVANNLKDNKKTKIRKKNITVSINE